MKKILLTLTISALFIGFNQIGANSIPLYEAPNAGNMDFYPMMQRQMEHEETLDFINNSDEYKKKRQKKNKQLEEQAKNIRNTNFNPKFKSKFKDNNLTPSVPSSMEFTKDENGNIIIKDINK